MDHVFLPEHGSKRGQYKEEMDLLVVALDEIQAGRFVEVADILASRLRMLEVGIEDESWESAKELLAHRLETKRPLVNPSMLDVMHAAAEKRQKREKRGLAVNQRAVR